MKQTIVLTVAASVLVLACTAETADPPLEVTVRPHAATTAPAAHGESRNIELGLIANEIQK